MDASIVRERSLDLLAFAEEGATGGTPRGLIRIPTAGLAQAMDDALATDLKALGDSTTEATSLDGILDLVGRVAFLHWENGNRNRAVQLLERGLRLDPRDPLSLRYMLLGILLEHGKATQRRQAQSLLDACEAQDRGEDARWYYFRGLLEYQRHGRTLESLAFIQSGLEQNANLADYLVLDLNGKLKGAVAPPDRNVSIAAWLESAALHAVVARPAWASTPGALAWLKALGDPGELRAALTSVDQAQARASRSWGTGSPADRDAQIEAILADDPNSVEAHLQQAELVEREQVNPILAWKKYASALAILDRDQPEPHGPYVMLLFRRALRGAARMAWTLGDITAAQLCWDRARAYGVYRTIVKGKVKWVPIEFDEHLTTEARLHEIACVMETGIFRTKARGMIRNRFPAHEALVDRTYFDALYMFSTDRFSSDPRKLEAIRAMLQKAMQLNPFVPEYLISPSRLPVRLPVDYDTGDRADAMRYALYARNAWKAVNGALCWLAGEYEPRDAEFLAAQRETHASH